MEFLPVFFGICMGFTLLPGLARVQEGVALLGRQGGSSVMVRAGDKCSVLERLPGSARHGAWVGARGADFSP